MNLWQQRDSRLCHLSHKLTELYPEIVPVIFLGMYFTSMIVIDLISIHCCSGWPSIWPLKSRAISQLLWKATSLSDVLTIFCKKRSRKLPSALVSYCLLPKNLFHLASDNGYLSIFTVNTIHSPSPPSSCCSIYHTRKLPMRFKCCFSCHSFHNKS